MTVGDINSQAIGSGARYNEGKVPYHLLPIRVLAVSEELLGQNRANVSKALTRLANWQEGGDVTELYEAAWELGGEDFGKIAWAECAAVFDYGRKKYAEWNWAKGMAWSVPLGCAVRHLLAISKGEQTDAESSLSHRGHFLCNIVMLITYHTTYLEGDDRPVKFLSRKGDQHDEDAAATKQV